MQAHEVVGRIQFLGGIRERPQFLVPSVGSPNVAVCSVKKVVPILCNIIIYT